MVADILKNIKALIIDMDGVLWRDSQPLGDLTAIFLSIEEMGLKYVLATNNATRTVDEYHQKLSGFGVTIPEGGIINSAQAVGIYLAEQYPEGANLYVVGQPSLKSTLLQYNLNVVDESEKDVQVVVASMDLSLSYEKLKHASLLIQSGCEFIGTNPDRTLPTPEGLTPGSGTVIGALEIASGRTAKYIGKPEPLLYEMALRRLGVQPEVTLAVGDRLETDIIGAHRASVHTALVLTGASTREQALAYNPKPEIITQDFTELIKLWTQRKN